MSPRPRIVLDNWDIQRSFPFLQSIFLNAVFTYAPSFDLFPLECVGKEPSILLFPGIYLKPCLMIGCQVCLQALPVPALPYHMAAHSKAGSAFHAITVFSAPDSEGDYPLPRRCFLRQHRGSEGQLCGSKAACLLLTRLKGRLKGIFDVVV